MKLTGSALAILIILIPFIAFAAPPSGFFEGPYIRLIGGMISATIDKNERTGENLGNDYEGSIGFQFGWNLWDYLAPELQFRYSTHRVGSNREHIVNVNLNAKYSFVTNALTSLKGFQILPFVQAGPTGVIGALPSDPAVGNKLKAIWGLGFGGGLGVDFLIMKYIFCGIIFQCDAYYFSSVNQHVDGGYPLIYGGKWEPQISLMGALGVHF